MFKKYIIETNDIIFNELSNTCQFEKMTFSRQCANIVDSTTLIPIVRTTSKYQNPLQKFQSCHYQLIDEIKRVTNNNELKFNNAMVEVYSSHYDTMKYHSDQALDLDQNSFICLFSCYQNPSDTNTRILRIKNKTTLQEQDPDRHQNTSFHDDISLDHNSIVLFSYDTNLNYLHKIISQTGSNDVWLGVTFRFSKTFINIVDNVPYFYPSNRVLTLATQNERNDFYRMRGQENMNIMYEYPEINYTISPSDLLPVS